ncbi:MAG TPA: phosphopantothenoylcysteine decarboxylase, partial [Candidatus Dormibacteraeota bacterium]|nr:phosphopantothenoylcysteine decarboxylase [Candidatus Dormibacteraeota bacterium]
ISNYSSGKMGFALASAAADRGAKVVLITTVSHPEHRGIEVQHVESAQEMLGALKSRLKGMDLLIMAAAVADYRPARRANGKIRREETPTLNLQLEAVPDLLMEIAADKSAANVYRVGFAAEDSDLDKQVDEKIKRKGLDAIVGNDISRHDIGFGSDYNEGVLIFADGSRTDLKKMTKREMADRILDLVLPKLKVKVH